MLFWHTLLFFFLGTSALATPVPINLLGSVQAALGVTVKAEQLHGYWVSTTAIKVREHHLFDLASY